VRVPLAVQVAALAGARRGQAASEAHRACEAAAVSVEDVVDGWAAVVAGNKSCGGIAMNENGLDRMRRRFTVSICFMLLLFPVFARSQTAGMAGASGQQRSFATPEEAAAALIRAAESYDVLDLISIFGPDGKDLISSADPVNDKQKAAEFVAKAKQKREIIPSSTNKDQFILCVGNDDWPLPIPLVKKNGRWVFNTKSGKTEVLLRRIGANELDAIQICHGYVEAQREYALQAKDGVNQYAQRIISSAGKQDGLYWKNADGTPGGPISEEIARAIQEGYTARGPYHGYYFKILKGQGPAAPLGKLDYVIQGVMIGGFALVAVPAEYRVTGVETFLVNQDDIVYQSDLGPQSLEIVKRMELYNPDKSWHRTDGLSSSLAKR
jgi:hypothetical protein